jgi:Domain of unknown function (DUF4259)
LSRRRNNGGYMGAWGHKSFENDDALDWLGKLELKGFPLIVEAFSNDEKVLAEGSAACAAIAAAEVVAALKGNPADSIPESLSEWVKGRPQPTTQFVERAQAVIDAILDESELKGLWADGEDAEIWKRDVENLRSRLS